MSDCANPAPGPIGLGRSRFGAALVLAACLLAGPAMAQGVITVTDRLSLGQQEETIAVFFAGQLAGTLHVDADHPTDQFSVAISLVGELQYTLCGTLLRREPDGSVSSHPIDNGGRLRTGPGHTLSAMTRGDVVFLLRDETGDEGTPVPGPVCAAAVS